MVQTDGPFFQLEWGGSMPHTMETGMRAKRGKLAPTKPLFNVLLVLEQMDDVEHMV
jgi:hypothetical protein